MSNFWMVRAGEGGYLVDKFESTESVGIGWSEAGDFTPIETLEAMKARLASAYAGATKGWINTAAGMTFKFRKTMQPGDGVITYDPSTREYLVGKITGAYEYRPGLLPDDYAHLRKVSWAGRVGRDALSVASRNTLGSTLTIFEPGDAVRAELDGALQGRSATVATGETTEESDTDLTEIRRDLLDRAHEFIKDRLLALTPDDMELLVAAVLRAMGFKARVSAKGPDRGRDVMASPDGLGFQQPRIVAEVKHRQKQAMGALDVRGFLGGLRSGDHGLYVSTGGFTKEARYEAERASIPTTLVDLDQLASLVVEHYERFDSDGRSLIPLMRVYWPVT